MGYYDFPNRTLCSVLEDMRDCLKTLNFAVIGSLIEEVQVIGNRMEAALYDQKDFKKAEKHYKDLKLEIKKLEEAKEELKSTE